MRNRKLAVFEVPLIVMKTYLDVLEDNIKISLDCIRRKSTDEGSKWRFLWKRFRCAIPVTISATTPSSASMGRTIIPDRNRLSVFKYQRGRIESERINMALLPWSISKTVEKSTTPATTTAIEVVRHVDRTECSP